MRIVHQMSRAHQIVARNPGCSILFVARQLHIGADKGTDNASGYNPVHRAIKAGLIRATKQSGRYSLHAA